MTALGHRLASVGRRSHLALVISLTAVGAMADVGTAAAAGAVFSITPTSRAPYFVFDSSPGALIRGAVNVVNVSSVGGTARLFAVDATTGQTSGAVYESEGAPRRMVGAWIKPGSGTVTLGPHQGASVSFSVAVPAGERGGQYLGGLVVAPVTPTATSTTNKGSHIFHVNIQEIAVVAVQVDLPGPLVPRLLITGVSASGRPGYQTLLLSLDNTGNSLLKGRGRINVSRSGRSVLDQTFRLDTMVPDTSIDFPVYVRGPRLPPGQYVARVTVPYTGGHVARGTFDVAISGQQVRQTFGSTAPPGAPVTASGSSSSIPVWVIGLGALALIAASIGGSALYFRRRIDSRRA
jgi:hypothetical protein